MMSLRGNRDPTRPAAKPRFHLPPGFRNRLGPFEHTRVGNESDKSQEAWPGEADWLGAAEFGVELGLRRLVLRK